MNKTEKQIAEIEGAIKGLSKFKDFEGNLETFCESLRRMYHEERKICKLGLAINPPTPTPSKDSELDDTIEQRDHWESKSSELACLASAYFGFNIGEHTSANCPVQNAIDYLDGRIDAKNDMAKPTPTPSTEYKHVPPYEMARIMFEGSTLEYETGSTSMYDSEDLQFIILQKHGLHALPFILWGDKCRIYQPPKKETRWAWEKEGAISKSITNQKYTESAIKVIMACPSTWEKIEESAEDFVIEGEE